MKLSQLVPIAIFSTLVGAVPATNDTNVGNYFSNIPKQTVLTSHGLGSGGKNHGPLGLASLVRSNYPQLVGRLETFGHPSFAHYALRLTRPDLCDTSVNQYSGFLDISQTRHLFFW